ncbi:MAG: AarF/ABC1/UbiB kinase family protein [Alphaproteobacteria bacterium]|nr:AarF/ABC1/UbiB kinase family protein [Alphaproteobacteria bacterium]MCB9696046.1 AarF/ABC1/UbiB kinase family protein [Alphaproteobacteria bacterium]
MSRWKRIATLGGLTSKVSASYLGNKVREAFLDEEGRKESLARLHVENAEQVAETLSHMKGAAMKLGQQLASAANALDLPDEVAGALSRLHKDAERVPFEQIRQDVEASLEMSLDEAYATFDPEPLGTASLAQAHVATLKDGTEVVVKVLHRGVAGAVDTDLMALKAMLLSTRALKRDRAEVDAAFEEIRVHLAQELDYLQEAVNIQAYQDALGRDPRVRIPRLHHALCTENVLTMDRLPGRHLDEWLPTSTPEARQRAGETLSDLYYLQLFGLRMLHADPHPGNYLFEPDGRVGMVDFGCVKRFDDHWIRTYAQAAVASLRADDDAILEACHELGAWNGTDPDDARLLLDFCHGLTKPFKSGVIQLGANREQIMEEMKPILARFVKRPTVIIPKDVLLPHRSLGGLYAIHRKLGTRTDFGAILERHAKVAAERQ